LTAALIESLELRRKTGEVMGFSYRLRTQTIQGKIDNLDTDTVQADEEACLQNGERHTSTTQQSRRPFLTRNRNETNAMALVLANKSRKKLRRPWHCWMMSSKRQMRLHSVI